MGIGDSIIATAEARHYNELYGYPVVFSDGKAVFYEPDIYANNPRIAKDPRQGDKVVVVRNYPGCRPYIAGGDSKRWYWNTDFQVSPGELFLTPEELERGKPAEGRIIIEPHVKDTSYSQNKHWPHWDRFCSLAKDAGIYNRLAQCRYDSRTPLAHTLKTPSFRVALAMIANADLVVTTDGALHHACAALGVPCVVLWGGLVGPDILGYPEHRNIRAEGVESCGSKAKCSHCHAAMRAIEPETVLRAVLEAGK